jgi:hypothetical protein
MAVMLLMKNSFVTCVVAPDLQQEARLSIHGRKRAVLDA